VTSYDDAGNLLTVQDNSGTTGWRYTYDHRNRLVTVEDTSNIEATPPNWNEKAAYVYDGLNRRVKKDLDTGTDILYIYDGWQCIEERNAASPSTVLRQYVYGGQYIDEVVCKIEDPGGTPAKLFYLHDCNYNVVALTNTSGAVQERYNYEPYGGLTIAEADYDVISATKQNNSLTFQGQRYDAESGLYYFRNRYLSPVLGRFLQRDTVGYVDGMNLYEFTQGRPTSALDPTGDLVDTYWFPRMCKSTGESKVTVKIETSTYVSSDPIEAILDIIHGNTLSIQYKTLKCQCKQCCCDEFWTVWHPNDASPTEYKIRKENCFEVWTEVDRYKDYATYQDKLKDIKYIFGKTGELIYGNGDDDMGIRKGIGSHIGERFAEVLLEKEDEWRLLDLDKMRRFTESCRAKCSN